MVRLGEPQNQSGRSGEERNLQPRLESNPRTPIIQPGTNRYANLVTPAVTLNVK